MPVVARIDGMVGLNTWTVFRFDIDPDNFAGSLFVTHDFSGIETNLKPLGFICSSSGIHFLDTGHRGILRGGGGGGGGPAEILRGVRPTEILRGRGGGPTTYSHFRATPSL